MTIQAVKPGPKRTANSTGKPDQRQRDNKGTPGNTLSLNQVTLAKKDLLDFYMGDDVNDKYKLIKKDIEKI